MTTEERYVYSHVGWQSIKNDNKDFESALTYAQLKKKHKEFDVFFHSILPF